MDIASAASNGPRICPFLRTVDEHGSLRDPILWPDQANRCTALGDAAPQSLRQQEYACLVSSHVNCPRFVRGGLAMVEPSAQARSGMEFTPAIAAALLVLAASFALSVGFVVANGGMNLPSVASPGPLAAEGSAGPASSQSPAASTIDGSPAPSVEPTAQPTPEASVQAETSAPSPQPRPTPSLEPTASPTSDRYSLLTPCSDAPDCWIYVVRSGDNLVSIARYFGVPLAVVYERNPWAETTRLVAGQELRLPPPTR
jgi:LysM repeat protein